MIVIFIIRGNLLHFSVCYLHTNIYGIYKVYIVYIKYTVPYAVLELTIFLSTHLLYSSMR